MTDISSLFEYIYLFTLGIAAGISLISFQKHYAWFWKWFSVFLVFYFAAECYGTYLSKKNVHNLWLYNPAFICMFLTEAFVYYHLLEKRSIKKFIVVYCIAFIVFCILNTAFVQDADTIETNIYVTGGTFSFTFAVLYFIQLFFSKTNAPLKYDSGFWLSVGTITSYAGEVPFLGMLNYLAEHFEHFTRIYYSYVIFLLDTFYNVCVMLVFLWMRKAQR